MLQEVFRIPGLNIPIYGYGLMMVVGMIAALQLARFLARRSQIDPEIFVNCAILALVTGIVGARLSHVLENWSVYTNPARSFGANLFDAINIRSGGLTFYGGFLLAFPCCVAYALSKKVPVRRGMDIVAPCLMIGLCFGRVGCLLNGCCEGAACTLSAPLGLQFPYHTNPYLKHFNDGSLNPSQLPPSAAIYQNKVGDPVPMSRDEINDQFKSDPQKRDALLASVNALRSNSVLPAQLFSAITAALIALLLVGYYSLPHIPGRVFALMLMIESPSRFLLEMLRAEPAFVGRHSPSQTLTFLPDISFSMFVSSLLFLLGVGLWLYFRGPVDELDQPQIPKASLAAA